MAESIRLGILGLGTVGTGVVQLVNEHQSELQHQTGSNVEVTRVLVSDINKERGAELEGVTLTESYEEVVTADDVDIVIEVMGGIDHTLEVMKEAFKNGKHVVTANKDLLALHGTELHEAAAANDCDLYYEASVAGGIPILSGLKSGLSSDRITKMMGIVNGTTNFILSKMKDEGRTYEDVLKEAQDLGFAESDPAADVDGLDAARKMAILGTLGFSMNIDLEDVDTAGIRNVTLEDMTYADRLGYTLKLIGLAERGADGVHISVEPLFVPADHPLAAVKNEYNAVYVHGEAVGETMFYGPGAGSLPTATAVVSDLITVIKNVRLGVSGHDNVAAQHQKQLKPKSAITSKYYLRLHVADETGVFESITQKFAEEGISFEKILQVPVEANGNGKAEIVLITHETNGAAYEALCQELNNLASVKELKSNYRVEGGQTA
ncbi:homoserine dehydrogenase [Salsuginibacillus halophilus]|uniref:Homoserine dehydrogenase n=1 Tax=Salsuginibacillus halophilus TaxID=517424 RepID=A0A2P8HE11_9BACI|nr:homoserine dehydrogenase [Salsuginibacillus halophilus]PSL44453.1 homoserine dehydrogenase [Salsuginibacillus halophilus]